MIISSKLINRCIKVPFVISLIILIIAQILLRIPFVGGSLPVSGVADYERTQSHTGQILVKLEEGYEPNANIKVLVNGNEAASLATGSIELSVMNNSVIEIDGRQVDYPFEVALIPVDRNITGEGDYCAVDGNLVRLTRVLVNNK